MIDWQPTDITDPGEPPRLELPEEWRAPGGWLVLGQHPEVAQERQNYRHWVKGCYTATEEWEEYWRLD